MKTFNDFLSVELSSSSVDFYAVTPEFAKHLIEMNTENRVIKWSDVAKISSDMKTGRWQTTHQGVAVSTTGRLLDGQKRVHAIADSGVTVIMQITTGLPDSAFKVIDIGQKRDLADRSGISKNHSPIISLAMVIGSLDKDDIDSAKIIYRSMSPLIDELLCYCNTSSKSTSHSAVRLAAICRMDMAKDKEEVNYVLEMYMNINLRNYDKFSKIMSSFANLVINQKNSVKTFRLLAMSMYMFSYKNRNKTILNLSSANEADLIQEARDLIKSKIITS